jgi:hypothetical protein
VLSATAIWDLVALSENKLCRLRLRIPKSDHVRHSFLAAPARHFAHFCAEVWKTYLIEFILIEFMKKLSLPLAAAAN